MERFLTECGALLEKAEAIRGKFDEDRSEAIEADIAGRGPGSGDGMWSGSVQRGFEAKVDLANEMREKLTEGEEYGVVSGKIARLQ